MATLTQSLSPQLLRFVYTIFCACVCQICFRTQLLIVFPLHQRFNAALKVLSPISKGGQGWRKEVSDMISSDQSQAVKQRVSVRTCCAHAGSRLAWYFWRRGKRGPAPAQCAPCCPWPLHSRRCHWGNNTLLEKLGWTSGGSFPIYFRGFRLFSAQNCPFHLVQLPHSLKKGDGQVGFVWNAAMVQIQGVLGCVPLPTGEGVLRCPVPKWLLFLVNVGIGLSLSA